MIKSIPKIALTLLLAAILASCTPTGEAYTDVSPTELKEILEEEDVFLVNVHIPYEGEIPNTDAFIPFDQIEDNLDQLPATEDAKIVLYCRSNRMSHIAAETLVGLGYTNLWNLDGGFIAWRDAGLPFEGGN